MWQLPLVERVFSPRETVTYLLGFSSLPLARRGLVLFLGGDVFYAVLLKKRTRYPLWVYGRVPRFPAWVDRYLVRFRQEWSSFPAEKRVYLGDLLYSVVLQEVKAHNLFPPGFPRFLFLPGSRKFAYSSLFPLFGQWMGVLREKYPEASFALGLPGHYSFCDLPPCDFSSLGVTILFGMTSELLSEADCVITVPGSNNLEIVYRKKKGMVVFPIAPALHDLPVTGFLSIVEKFPYWGKMIKRAFLLRALSRRKWLSLPNIVWDREILPELVGEISPQCLVQKVEEVFHRGEEDFREEIPQEDVALSLARMIEEVFYGEASS